MLIFEITKEYAPAFEDFVPGFILGQIGRAGYHTLGEVSCVGEEQYATGLLQYYDGSLIRSGTARITYLCVPEEERGETNAWSLLKEMEKRLTSAGIRRAQIRLAGLEAEALRDFMTHMGFSEKKPVPALLRTELGTLFHERILACPASKAVRTLKDVPLKEVRRLLHSVPEKELAKAGIHADLSGSDYEKRLSFLYKDSQNEGLFLTAVVPEGGVSLRLCKIMGKDTVRPLLAMAAEAGRLLTKICTRDTPVLIPCVNSNTEEVLRKMIPDIRLDPVWMGEIAYG